MTHPVLCLIEPIEEIKSTGGPSKIAGVLNVLGYSTEKVGRASGGLIPSDGHEPNYPDILSFVDYLRSNSKGRLRMSFHRHFPEPPARRTMDGEYQYAPTPDILELLALPSLRPAQSEAIARLLSRQDVLVDLPTGYGKTAIPFTFGLEVHKSMADGITALVVMVVPLAALARNHAAYFLNRGYHVVHWTGRKTLLGHEPLGDGRRPVLVVMCPESVDAFGRRFHTLGMSKPALVVFDEAHCMVDDGHDYRPKYRELVRRFVQWFAETPWLYLTATPSPMLKDWLTELKGREPGLVRIRHSRPNIRIEARPLPEVADDSREASLISLANSALDHITTLALEGKTLVFCDNRKLVDYLVSRLQELLPTGCRVEHYYSDDQGVLDRSAIEQDFSLGRIGVLVSTRAIAMGVDIPNLTRMLFLWPPENIRLFYQMVGRLGRQGQESRAVLLVEPSRMRVISEEVRRDSPDARTAALVLKALWVLGRPSDAQEIAFEVNDRSSSGSRVNTRRGARVSQEKIGACLKALASAGFLEQSGERVPFYTIQAEWATGTLDRHIDAACRFFSHRRSDWQKMKGFAKRNLGKDVSHDNLVNALNSIKKAVRD